MSFIKRWAVAALSALALAGFGANSAAADYAVHITNPGAVALNAPSSLFVVGGSPAFDCDITLSAASSTGGAISGVSFTINPGTPNCSYVTATSTGGVICEEAASGHLYLEAQITVFSNGTPVSFGSIRGGMDDAGTLLSFDDAPILGFGSLAIDGDYDVVGDPIEIDKPTSDPCPV